MQSRSAQDNGPYTKQVSPGYCTCDGALEVAHGSVAGEDEEETDAENHDVLHVFTSRVTRLDARCDGGRPLCFDGRLTPLTENKKQCRDTVGATSPSLGFAEQSLENMSPCGGWRT